MRRHPAGSKKWGENEVSQQLLKQDNEYGHDDRPREAKEKDLLHDMKNTQLD